MSIVKVLQKHYSHCRILIINMEHKLTKKLGNVTAVLGGQWGDEGKGKLIDILSEEYEIIVRGTGGANAGHTVYVPDSANPGSNKKFIFHLMPSGMLHPKTIGVIGNGCVIHLPTLFEEITLLEKAGISVKDRFFISDRAQLVFEYHKIIDGIQEESKGKHAVGTTKRGIGPAYMDKSARTGIRVIDLLDFERFDSKIRSNYEALKKVYGFNHNIDEEIENYRELIPKLKPFITDTAKYIHEAIKNKKSILIEGANGTLLDIDHGTYPYCTSSNASIGGALAGTGIGASALKSTIGIMKAYMTRVGAGPFPTEQDNSIGEKMRTKGHEFGSTTGRPRRCGWFDAVASKYSTQINGMTSINLTKLDVLDEFETIKIAVSYTLKGEVIESMPASALDLEDLEADYIEMPGWNSDTSKAKKVSDLPQNAQTYIEKIAEILECPVNFIGVGVARDEMIIDI